MFLWGSAVFTPSVFVLSTHQIGRATATGAFLCFLVLVVVLLGSFFDLLDRLYELYYRALQLDIAIVCFPIDILLAVPFTAVLLRDVTRLMHLLLYHHLLLIVLLRLNEFDVLFLNLIFILDQMPYSPSHLLPSLILLHVDQLLFVSESLLVHARLESLRLLVGGIGRVDQFQGHFQNQVIVQQHLVALRIKQVHTHIKEWICVLNILFARPAP